MGPRARQCRKLARAGERTARATRNAASRESSRRSQRSACTSCRRYPASSSSEARAITVTAYRRTCRPLPFFFLYAPLSLHHSPAARTHAGTGHPQRISQFRNFGRRGGASLHPQGRTLVHSLLGSRGGPGSGKQGDGDRCRGLGACLVGRHRALNPRLRCAQRQPAARRGVSHGVLQATRCHGARRRGCQGRHAPAAVLLCRASARGPLGSAQQRQRIRQGLQCGGAVAWRILGYKVRQILCGATRGEASAVRRWRWRSVGAGTVGWRGGAARRAGG